LIYKEKTVNSTTFDFQSYSVLIIDDNPTNLEILVSYLGELGFEIIVARSGMSGIKRAKYTQPNIILLDVMMPGIDGFETCRRLKADDKLKDIPVIFITALTDVEHKVKGFQIGAVDYVTKPIQQEEVLARITAHLRLRDLTERLQIQTTKLLEANHRLQEEVRARQQAEESLARQAKELARSNAELEQFAYVASHDLREPLRKIKSYTQLLEKRYKGQLDARADKYITYIVNSTSRMQRLITDLLTYSRVGRLELALDPTDMNLLLKQVQSDLGLMIKESHALITSDSLPTVMVIPSQISNLLQNLIGNSIKFRREEPPQIHVGVEQIGNEWQFSVRDNGIGIEDEYAERIFIIFQRLHTRTEYSGTGIGLAICKKIVERHGGSICMQSQFGKGTTFYFTLPID